MFGDSDEIFVSTNGRTKDEDDSWKSEETTLLTSLTSLSLCADLDFTIFGCNGSLSFAINLSPQSSEPLPSAKLVHSSMNGVPALPFGRPSLQPMPLSRRALSPLSSSVDIIVTRLPINQIRHTAAPCRCYRMIPRLANANENCAMKKSKCIFINFSKNQCGRIYTYFGESDGHRTSSDIQLLLFSYEFFV